MAFSAPQPHDDDMKNQMEVLRLSEQYRTNGLDTPASPAPQKVAPPDEKQRPKGSFGTRCKRLVLSVIPVAGDSNREIVRKVLFIVSLLVLIFSVGYILNENVIAPAIYNAQNEELKEMYNPKDPVDLTEEEEAFTYPEGMSDAFKKLYFLNQDIYGWLNYTATNSDQWLKIDYPVMHAADNDYYLTHDFYRSKSKNGALFMDFRNSSAVDAANKNIIIYGHNMGSGQMFSRLNYLITESLYNIRTAATFSFDTLYEQRQYKVFAVMVTNTKSEDGPIFNYMRTNFASDHDFLQFVAECRARSIYDFNDVTVEANDELIMLSTCSPSSKAHFKDGRTVVVARRVREGEAPTTNTSKIVMNKDCIYPLAYYKNQDLPIHPYYEGDFEITPTGVSTQSTSSTKPTTKPTAPSGSDGDGGDDTTGTTKPSGNTTKPSSGTTKPSSGTTKPTTKPAPTTPSGSSGTTVPTKPSESGDSTASTTPSGDGGGDTTSSTEPTTPSGDGGDNTTSSTEPTQPSDEGGDTTSSDSGEGGDTTSSTESEETQPSTGETEPSDNETEPSDESTQTDGE